MNDLYPPLFSRPIRKSVPDETAPEWIYEFDPVYIKSLAYKYRNDQLKFGWRMRVADFGSWLISLGRHVEHMAHLPFAARHTSWKALASEVLEFAIADR